MSSVDHLHIDFETRSLLDLKVAGMWNYVRDPSTEVWCMAWAFGDAEPDCIPLLERTACPTPIVKHIEAGGPVYAHNAPFEFETWNEIMVPRHGWPTLVLEQLHCTMALAYAMGLPGALEDASLAVGLHANKDIAGRSLMLRMARPRSKPGVTPTVWWDQPDKLERLYAYCKQDVRVERELSKRLCPLSARERAVQLMDWRINRRGVGVDLETARAGAAMAEAIKARAGERLSTITGGAVTSPTALGALKAWCRSKGVEAESLDKDAIETLLAGELHDDVRAALVQRQEAGKASVAKLDKIVSLAGTDARLHYAIQYHGASTGRWAARGVQVHNLVRNMPPRSVVEEILGHVRDGALDWIDVAYGPPMEMISQCLRSFFVPGEGRVQVGGDFSGVESRGGAWVSGEEWKLHNFRKQDIGEGPDNYVVAASRLLHIPVEEVTKELRQSPGKISELAFQYQGGVGAGKRFSPDTPVTQLQKWKVAWREMHPGIVKTWADLENAAVAAVLEPGKTFRAGHDERHVRFKKAGSFLWCRLPSGRIMCYPYPKLLPGRYGNQQLTYMTVPSENDKGKIIKDIQNANNWARIGTYGGALMENVVQAICRDLLADCMLELHRQNYDVVLHVHDEIILECREAYAESTKDGMEQVLRTAPVWATDFPLWADCTIMRRYGK